MILKRLVLIIAISFWPISLCLANTSSNFISYVIPSILILLCFILFRFKHKLYLLPVVVIPFFEPKLAIFPIIFALVNFATERTKLNATLVLSSLLVLTLVWLNFVGQTIFVTDYQANQKVIRETHLYNSVLVARVFHNKARVYLDKFTYNLFALTDPNNYFFGFHPRQIVGNQNLTKFPFLGIVLIFYGLYFLKDFKYKNFVIISFTAACVSLSLLSLFDRNDFILWVPLSLILIHGTREFCKRFKFSKAFLVIFLVFAIPELLKVIFFQK